MCIMCIDMYGETWWFKRGSGYTVLSYTYIHVTNWASGNRSQIAYKLQTSAVWAKQLLTWWWRRGRCSSGWSIICTDWATPYMYLLINYFTGWSNIFSCLWSQSWHDFRLWLFLFSFFDSFRTANTSLLCPPKMHLTCGTGTHSWLLQSVHTNKHMHVFDVLVWDLRFSAHCLL